MVKDIAGRVISIGDNVIILSRRNKNSFESDGVVIGIKELFDRDTDKVTQRVKVETVEVSLYNSRPFVQVSWFNPYNLVVAAKED